eukprot:TRINITY_DN3722_c0_g1_i1.p1 TRINITY_DN3722_c0_g1~~TRINITY_DN3722_c0_g1_i1.p1  ORF type:complete len:627 (+),score=246.79 TRINITY_DN3722_c0_g1_i1:36-1883(+)
MYRLPLAALLVALAPSANAMRGVAPEDVHKYEAATFTCDGGRTIPKDHVNDDYCDCKDGSDEPSTSACAGIVPRMTFWCVNEGHKGEHIHQSRINDGICDCCDGTDEFATDAGCKDICIEVATVRAKEHAEQEAKTAAGLAEKAKLIARAKELIDAKKAELANWESQIGKAKSDMETAEVVKSTEEAIENSERDAIRKESEAKKAIHDKEKAERDAEKAALDATYAAAHAEKVAAHGEPTKGGKVAVNKPLTFKDGKTATLGATGVVHSTDPLIVTLDMGFSFEAGPHDVVPTEKQELQAEPEGVPNVCIGWKQTSGCDPKSTVEEHASKDCSEKVYNGASGFCECEGGKRHEFTCEHEDLTCQQVCEGDGDVGDEITEPCPPEYPYPIKHDANYGRMLCYKEKEHAEAGSGPCGTWCARNDEFWDSHKCVWGCDCGVQCAAKVDLTEKVGDSEADFVVDTGSSHIREDARRARDEYNRLKNAHDDLERKIDEAKKELETNYGPESEFLPYKNECFEHSTPEYTYKLCPFKEVMQGHTNMGKWGSWGQQTYGSWGGQDDLSIMKYENGQNCWNGPARSTEVKIICGPTNLVRSVAEPSMCAYSMVWETPAACVSQ